MVAQPADVFKAPFVKIVGGEVAKSNPARLPKYHLLNSFWLKNKLELKIKSRVLIILIFFIIFL
jgi:hypothetical protein